MGNAGVMKGFLSTAVAMVMVAFCAAVIPAGASAAAWGDNFDVSVPANLDQGTQEGSVVAGPDNSFIYVWGQDLSNGESGIFSRVSYGDGTLGPIRRVASSNLAGNPAFPVASAGADGLPRVVWRRIVASCTPSCVFGYQLEYQKLDRDGLPVGAPSILDSTPIADADTIGYAAISTASDGSSLVSWTVFDSSATTTAVRSARVPSSGSPSAAATVFTSSTLNTLAWPTAAAKPGGGGFVSWLSSGQNRGVQGSMVGPSGTSTTPQFLTDTNDPVFYDKSTIDSQGKGTVFYTRSDSGTQRVTMRQMDSSGAVIGASPQLISGAAAGSGGLGTIDAKSDGTVLFSWQEENSDIDSDSGVWVRTASPAGTLGTTHRASPANVDAREAISAVSPLGGGMIAWRDLTADPDQVLARNLDGNLVPVGNPTVLATNDVSTDDLSPLGVEFAPNGDASVLSSFYIDADDSAGELNANVYDAAPPELTPWIPSKATVGQEIVAAAEATDRSPIEYSWTFGDGGTATGAFAKHTFTGPGTYPVQVTATDSAGNQATTSANVEVLPAFVDPPVPPNTTITGKPAKKVKSKTATFKFISSLSGSKFECRLDKAGWSDCKSPKKLKKLKAGKHTFKVRAIKGDLIDATPASYGWTVKKPKKKK